jgi:hypothetical protein
MPSGEGYLTSPLIVIPHFVFWVSLTEVDGGSLWGYKISEEEMKEKRSYNARESKYILYTGSLPHRPNHQVRGRIT